MRRPPSPGCSERLSAGTRPASERRRERPRQGKKTACFPFSARGRLPNFDSAKEAAERRFQHSLFRGVKAIKLNPDASQRWVGLAVLERGFTVGTPASRRKDALRKRDSRKIRKERYAVAAAGPRAGASGTRPWRWRSRPGSTWG